MKNDQTTIISEEAVFKTDDINLAAFIKSNGGKLIDIKLGTESFRNRYYFLFENSEECNKFKFDYINGAVGVIKDFVDAKDMFVKEVKSLINGFQ